MTTTVLHVYYYSNCIFMELGGRPRGILRFACIPGDVSRLYILIFKLLPFVQVKTNGRQVNGLNHR